MTVLNIDLQRKRTPEIPRGQCKPAGIQIYSNMLGAGTERDVRREERALLVCLWHPSRVYSQNLLIPIKTLIEKFLLNIYKPINISFFLGRSHGSKIIITDYLPIHFLPKFFSHDGVRSCGWMSLRLREPPRKLE